MKYCPKCQQHLDESDFQPSRVKEISAPCRECCRAYKAQYRARKAREGEAAKRARTELTREKLRELGLPEDWSVWFDLATGLWTPVVSYREDWWRKHARRFDTPHEALECSRSRLLWKQGTEFESVRSSSLPDGTPLVFVKQGGEWFRDIGFDRLIKLDETWQSWVQPLEEATQKFRAQMEEFRQRQR